ncbi:pre-mRNA-processing factor 17-like [Macrosteles quadrilineatus]|uniref:pre-mRNA-processing factor 17-like n=1 Tax=Macrosteles quadrilineatus TaxID=74068 RepID=UPI0023E1AC41|nr:pre-mRNA-processing factor 17-like [Macrosteles quadrilineatus]XP_054267479.1 pre-mRNA-processing factor 17-like [Macrosteles quadrilineatus]
MLQIQQYSDSGDSDFDENATTAHLKPLDDGKTIAKIALSNVCAAPDVTPMGPSDSMKFVDVTTKELTKNLKYEELFAPELGPENPFLTQQQRAQKNTLSGFVEKAHISEFQFENQRRTFSSYGYAIDPTVDNENEGKTIVGATLAAEETSMKTVFEATTKRPLDKRKRKKNDDPGDIEGFLGPWGGFKDEQRVMKPNEAEAEELEEYLAKKQKRGKQSDDKPLEEKTVLHIKDSTDYQGRSFIHPPQDVGVNLKSETPPDRCFLPKSHIHTWQGHTKGISAIRWFPHSAHLLLSCSMDCRVKLWEVYKDRRCVRTYYGHRQAVRDIAFNNPGTQFLSAAYDRYIKLWDTETGECISRFTSRKIPYCVKFNPDEDKQHLFVAGTSDKKIICWDTRSGEIVQEYDRHLGAVNSITFVDENRRFVTTSDDKSLRVWEWDIPVDMKYIADPSMHSMPAVTPSPNHKWLACQSMDNKIVIFSALNRFKLNRKKTFTGHMVAGYACSLDFSPDMSYIVSGDADGKTYVWDWKTTKLFSKWKAHDNVCISVLWHPHEPSKLATAGWDGLIKYWD